MNLPKDFSDRLSPMLVKELRQGLRTRTFTSAFLLLQAVLVFTMVVASAAGQAGEVLDGFFWFFLGLALVFIMPLRGINALSREQKENTLELVSVTQLSAYRIVSGKWAALFCQSLLLTIAVLPYVVLRYFFGGVNLLQDLIGLGFLLLASSAFTAFTVGISAFRSLLLRGLLFLGIGFLVLSGFQGIYTMLRFGGIMPSTLISGNSIIIPSLITIFILGVFFTFYFLAMGASRVAAVSENYSTTKRLLSLAALILTFLLPLIGISEELCFGFAIVIITPVLVDALTEKAAVSRIVLRNFANSRFLPTRAAFFLAPGWHTGIFYFLIVATIFIVTCFAFLFPPISGEDELSAILITYFSALVFPMLVIHLSRRPTDGAFKTYIIIQMICSCLTAIIAMPTALLGTDTILLALFFLPHTSLVLLMDYTDYSPLLGFFQAVLIIATIIVSAVRARPLYTQMSLIVGELEKSQRPPTDDDDKQSDSQSNMHHSPS
ncbi:MAG: hypothetical protein AAF591_01100 [Verrucomicrobiota bacterium]